MKTVGVCIIAKNEEALIGRLLKSVQGAHQIVVCDTGSTDKTIEIAKQHGAEIYKDFIWCDDFAAAQNHAKSKMTTDWILSVDCDEYVHDFEEVKKAIELGTDYIRCHMIAEGSQPLEFGFSRLFRNCPEIYWCQPIHKHLNRPGAGEEVGNVKITFGWSPAHAADPDRALRILERTVAAEAEPGRNLYYLGREYFYKRRYKESTVTLGRYVQISGWPAEKAEAFFIMSQCYSAQGLDEDARDACLQAIKLNPEFREAVQWMGSISPDHIAYKWYQWAKTCTNNDILWKRTANGSLLDITDYIETKDLKEVINKRGG